MKTKTKKCKACGNEKPLSCFYVRKRDGWVFAKCKDCYLKSDRRRRVEVAPEYREQGTNQKRKWRKRNPEAEKSYDANKRAKRAGVAGVLTKQDVEIVWQKYGGLCWVCGERAEQLDHFRPINPSAGGTNTPDNIRPICFECNHKRSHIWYGAEKAEREAQMIKQIQKMLRGNGTPSAESDCSVIEMGLCEVEHVMLRPNQLYRFTVMPGCDKCKSLDVYSPNETLCNT